MAVLSWHIVDSATFAAATTKDASALYFISDTNEIYRGAVLFSPSAEMYADALPAVKATNRIYINSTTLEGSIWNGTAWKTIIQPLGEVEPLNTNKAVSGAKIKTYVDAAVMGATGSGEYIKTLAWDKVNHVLTSTNGNSQKATITFEGLGCSLQYTAATGNLQMLDASGVAIGTAIKLDLERFVTQASYDPVKKEITLVFNDAKNPIVIPIGDLVDTYTVKSSNSLNLSMTSNEITGTVVVSNAAGNQATITAQGIYVAATDITGKLDKLAASVAGEIVKVAADGTVTTTGAKIGGAVLDASPSVSLVATEAAVAAVRTALTTLIDTKMSKLTNTDADEVIIVGATGEAIGSNVKIGTGTFAATPTAAVLATELGVKTFGDANYLAKTDVIANGAVASSVTQASDVKPISEKAYVAGQTWKTTM